MNRFRSAALLIFSFLAAGCFAQGLEQLSSTTPPRWFTFENPSGKPGSAAMTNKGAKGHAYDNFLPGQSRDLLKVEGAGTIRRMWFTFRPWTPQMLRALKLEIFWDHSTKPAVSVPLGDFFGAGLAQAVPFQSALFSDPEGRSLCCTFPMPFRTGARVVLTNESKEEVGLLFYDIDVTRTDGQPKDAGYFHAYWHRDPMTPLRADYEILPKVAGKGRYLGATIGVQGNAQYEDSGWGEGEVKMFLDGDGKFPTISGTGTEDYIGTGWGMGPFSNLYQGCTVSDNKKHCWAFYRLHVPDPIFFSKDCRIVIQDIGGDATESVRKLKAKGAELEVVTAAADQGLVRILTDKFPKLEDKDFPLDAWVNFYRRDDYSSVAYFYLDKPFTDLPALAPVGQRISDLR